ncbi:MAG: ABC transporter permease subunit [Haloglomus sp.]
MNALVLAGKEFDDAIRSRSLLALTVVFVGALAAVTVGYALVTPRPRVATLLVYVVSLTKWLVPVAALVAGYDAVVGEREGRTLRLLFGLPYSRAEILIGKAVGRFAAVVAPVTVGLVVSFGCSLVLYRQAVPGRYLVVILAATLLAAAFVSLAVAASALGRSAVRVVAGVVGAFVLFLFLWDIVPATAYFLATGAVPGAHAPPPWYFLLSRLNPVESFLAVVTAWLPTMAPPAVAGRAVYLSGSAAVALLVGWAVVPLGLAYARFRAADLA